MKNGERAAVAQEWIAKAEDDLLNATHTPTLGARCPTDTVCLHAQQCAEKYLRALLSLRVIDFARTHDLEAFSARVLYGFEQRYDNGAIVEVMLGELPQPIGRGLDRRLPG